MDRAVVDRNHGAQTAALRHIDVVRLTDMQDPHGATGDAAVASVRSLGYRTDLSLLQMTGSSVVDRGDCLVVATTGNPHFWWGNFLLLRERPTVAKASGWVHRFEQELPWATHRAFGLDDPDAPHGAFSALVSSGHQVERTTVMTTDAVLPPPHPCPDAILRPLSGDDDWTQHVTLAMLIHHDAEDPTALPFVEARASAHRRAVESDSGVWVGAFVDGELVSQLGLLAAGAGLGRYQDVETHPDRRRQGLAGALVHCAAGIMLRSHDVETLVMVADPDDAAIRLYRSLGFTTSEHQLGAFLPPRKHTDPETGHNVGAG